MKKLYLYLLFILLIVFSPFLLKYLLINHKIGILNNIYFNFPTLINSKKDCVNYDKLLKNSLDNSFSVSIINEKGKLIGSYNENQLMVPASNLKLISTAYVLSKYKYKNNLKTSLLKTRRYNYYLIGEGDPDLNYSDINNLLSKIEENKNINLNILEINEKNYWPNGWTDIDKFYEYGSPITTLAIESNHNRSNNINTLNDFIKKYLTKKFPDSKVNVNNIYFNKLFYIRNANEIHSVISNPILSLLTLANSESHNFTAESLYKNASNTWDDNNYYQLKIWLRNKGLPVKELYFADASGLSRTNRINTKLIALFLDKMRYSKDFTTYQSTLSIMGVRGTLSNKLINSELKGKFFGKTGTLSNVFALSGYLYKNNKPLIISIIQNSDQIDRNKVFNLIEDIYSIKTCI